jgi:ABC-2 type transport system ATP-binding protein
VNDRTWLDAFDHELEAVGVAAEERVSARVETEGFLSEAGVSAFEHFGPPAAYAAELAKALGAQSSTSALRAHGPGSAIDVVGVSKSYRGRAVLRDVSLSVGRGEVVVLVGPNGAGKSTLLRIIAGVERADAGAVAVGGAIGYVPQSGGVDPHLSPEEHFELFGAPAGSSREQARGEGIRLARELGWDAASAPIAGKLSGGTVQKLVVITALLGRPETLLLDEPYQGMDADSQRRFWSLLWSWQDEGRSALLSSHAPEALAKASKVVEIVGLSVR